MIMGLVYIVVGLLQVIFWRKAARQGARFHQNIAKALPWLYRIPPADLATSEKVWGPLTILMGLFVAALGVAMLLGVRY
jgi:hypothetical protein